MPPYRRGFRTEAEGLSAEVRLEMGIGHYGALDPYALAEFLDVPILPLTALRAAPDAIAVLRGPEQAAFSAMTVFRGSRRVIVHNDAHSPARRASNLSHELAHGLLLHAPRPALDARGCREWDTEIEREATFLAGALLLPEKAIWWEAKKGSQKAAIAEQYGCSIELVQMRLNLTGAGKRFGSG
jgi:Zn-dependent peptidase ImmA (M78 family)